ncbi:MAG: hypothetical protein V3V99_11415 [candidate division Zixibacteria bacterium]
MQTGKIILAVIICAILIGNIQTASAQIVYGQSASVKARMTYTNWSVDYENGNSLTVNQFMIPVNGFLPLRDNWELRYHAASISGGVELNDGTENSLSGLGDLRLMVNHSLSDDRFLFSLGLNLPTGKKKLNLGEELIVMNLLSLNYLSFPVRRLGEGMGVNLLFGGAASNGVSRLGGTISYQYLGEYNPFDSLGDYDPGDMISLSANGDTKKGNTVFSASMTFSLFSADKADGQKLRKPSSQFEISTGFETHKPKYSYLGNVALLLRGRITNYDNNEEVFEQLRLYGNEFFINTALVYHPDKLWSFTPLVQLRVIGNNEFEDDNKQGSSAIFGFGGEYARNIGEGVDFNTGVTYFTGDADGAKIKLSGFQITGGLIAAF